MTQLFDPNPVTHSIRGKAMANPLFTTVNPQWRRTEDYLLEVNPNLQGSARAVAELFKAMTEALESIPNGAEKSAGMRKLLEARECFVRSVVP